MQNKFFDRRIDAVILEKINFSLQSTVLSTKEKNYTGLEFINAVEELTKIIKASTRPTRIAMGFDNSIEFIVGLFAILRAGCTVIIVPAAVDSELFRTFCHAASTTFYWKKNQSSILPELCSLNSIHGLLTAEQVDEAVIVFSSGTEGAPKGVVLTHSNLLHNIEASLQKIEISKGDKALALTPFSHVSGLRFFLSALYQGATLYVSPLAQKASDLLQTLEAEKINIFSASAVILAQFIALDIGGSRHPLKKLKAYTAGGAELPPRLRRDLLQRLQHAKFYSLYGMSESTSILCILDPEKAARKIFSAGEIIPGMEFKINQADERGIGELLIRGPSLMKNYLGQPCLGASEWFHTGDMAFVDTEGDLTIIGRLGEIIHTPEGKIYPRELERILCAIDSVREAYVCQIPHDTSSGANTCAFVAAADANITENYLYTQTMAIPLLAEKINTIILVHALPRNTMGKIDKSALLMLTKRDRM